MYGLAISSRTGTVDPVTLTEAKAHLRVDGVSEDTYITDLISAASQRVEEMQGKIFRQATMTMTLDMWPRSSMMPLPRYPVDSVTSITYLEEGESSATTYASTNYQLDTASVPPRIMLKKNKTWPTDSLEAGAAITVTFVAGYADGTVPETAKHAIKLLVGHWYANRESVVTGTIATEIPETLRSLILGDRLW